MEEKSEIRNPKSKQSAIEGLSTLYEKTYGLMADLKHFIYSASHLVEMESLALLLSRLIKEKRGHKNNAVWLVIDGLRVSEIARNTELVDINERRIIEIDTSEDLSRVIRDQLVAWSVDSPWIRDTFPGYQSPALFPIKAQPQAFGFLAIDNGNLAADERDLYQFIGHFAGLIFNMSSLYQTVVEKKEELSEMTDILFNQNAHLTTLHNIGVEMANVTDPVHLCRLVTETLVTDLGAVRAAAFILDEHSQELVGASGSGGLQGIDTMRLPSDRENAIRQSLESMRITSQIDYPGELQLGSNRLKDWVIFPLKGRKQVLGILIAEIADTDTSDSIAILANHAGMMLNTLLLLEERKKFAEELSRANEALGRLATIDFLTGLINHRFFQDRFDAEFSRGKRYGAELSLIMIDIDHFKQVNDHYGHAVGDQVLKAVSGRIRDNLRSSDIVARYGGEEFAALLPETNLDQARIAAEKLRSGVWDQPIQANGESLRISISIGMAGYPGPGIQSKEDLFNKADEALYRAKKAGRNRVEG